VVNLGNLSKKSLIHLESCLVTSEKRELRLEVCIGTHIFPVSSLDIGKISEEETVFRGKIVFEQI
jgi:hypothetical protein